MRNEKNILQFNSTNSIFDELCKDYVRVPENHIVIDFDYAELSKSGNGIHLHYIYTGDPTKLSRIYEERKDFDSDGFI